MVPKKSAAALVLTASRRRGEELLGEIARKKLFITEAFVDIGAALVELEKNDLFKALGYATFGDLLSEKARLTKRGIAMKTELHKVRAEWKVSVEMRVEDFASLR